MYAKEQRFGRLMTFHSGFNSEEVAWEDTECLPIARPNLWTWLHPNMPHPLPLSPAEERPGPPPGLQFLIPAPPPTPRELSQLTHLLFTPPLQLSLSTGPCQLALRQSSLSPTPKPKQSLLPLYHAPPRPTSAPPPSLEDSGNRFANLAFPAVWPLSSVRGPSDFGVATPSGFISRDLIADFDNGDHCPLLKRSSLVFFIGHLSGSHYAQSWSFSRPDSSLWSYVLSL